MNPNFPIIYTARTTRYARVGMLLLSLACSGCHMCDSCCDYLPPVLDGPYSPPLTRAGSVSRSYTPIEHPISEKTITHDSELSPLNPEESPDGEELGAPRDLNVPDPADPQPQEDVNL